MLGKRDENKTKKNYVSAYVSLRFSVMADSPYVYRIVVPPQFPVNLVIIELAETGIGSLYWFEAL